jgi:chromosome segregation ATPase
LHSFLQGLHIYYMNDLKAPIDTLKDKIEQLISSHAQLSQRLKNTEDENAELVDKLNVVELLEKDNAELSQRAEAVTRQLEEKEAQPAGIDITADELAALKGDNEELRAKLAQKEALLGENEVLISNLLQAETDLKAAVAEKEELARNLADNKSAEVDTAVVAEQTVALAKQLQDKDVLLAEKENQLKESQLLLKELGEKNKLHNLAQSISGNTSSEDNEGLKLIITDLVKEIDKCITLLGKNV